MAVAMARRLATLAAEEREAAAVRAEVGMEAAVRRLAREVRVVAKATA